MFYDRPTDGLFVCFIFNESLQADKCVYTGFIQEIVMGVKVAFESDLGL